MQPIAQGSISLATTYPYEENCPINNGKYSSETEYFSLSHRKWGSKKDRKLSQPSEEFLKLAETVMGLLNYNIQTKKIKKWEPILNLELSPPRCL